MWAKGAVSYLHVLFTDAVNLLLCHSQVLRSEGGPISCEPLKWSMRYILSDFKYSHLSLNDRDVF